MPLISHFYGILIYIYREKEIQHNKPHFHAKYAEHEAAYDLEGNLLSGNLPPKKNQLVETWAMIHEEELRAAWEAWNEYGETIKIEGLR
ncbi:MAG: DUF4160 domain-containing protein [Oscillospiraceae bacterium]|jgi:hypothetical protein|nr:DUF4160 domain-containing protein [Oscillospiraceae bacterium]